METEQPLYYHMHVGTSTSYLSLTLCGQLGSSNQSALCYQQPVTYTFIIDPSVFTYDSALSHFVMCAVLHGTMWCPSTYRYSALK